MKIKKTYSFAFKSSLYITFFCAVALYLSAYFFLNTVPHLLYFLAFILIVFLFTFSITQYRLEKFIYQRIKQIYENVSILDSSDLRKTSITSDINTLSKEVEKFAEAKQLQIQNLHLRDSYRKEFLGNVSHELKTPLFTVQGYLLTLMDSAINDKIIAKNYLNRANKGVERLISIVKDLDMISKLETDELYLDQEPFDIVKLTQDVFDLLEIKAKKRNIALIFKKPYLPIMVFADKERVEQVLTNLVVNSIKYGRTGGYTLVSFETKKDNKILVKVSDNGEGIKKVHLPRLFERFYRIDKSRSREQGGSGLGLAIVKHIIEAHGEQIFVKSKFKIGSEFSFTLERAEKF